MFRLLISHTQQHINDLEISKQQATEEWLRSRSEEEQEQYLQRIGAMTRNSLLKVNAL